MDGPPLRKLALSAAACGALSGGAALAGLATFRPLDGGEGFDATSFLLVFGPLFLAAVAFFTAVGFLDSLFTLADVDLARAMPLVAGAAAVAAFLAGPLTLLAGPIALCTGLGAMRLSRLLFRIPAPPGSDGHWRLHTLPRRAPLARDDSPSLPR